MLAAESGGIETPRKAGVIGGRRARRTRSVQLVSTALHHNTLIATQPSSPHAMSSDYEISDEEQEYYDEEDEELMDVDEDGAYTRPD